MDESTFRREVVAAADTPTLRRRAVTASSTLDKEAATTADKQNPTVSEQWYRWLPHGIFLVLLIGALALHLYHLGHTFLDPLDEAVHAIVAEHVELHPLLPTLYETAAVPEPDLSQWASVHIWLHILPFGMWASAFAMKLLGDTPFAMRLPGVLFMVAGMISTYFLGRRLFAGNAGNLVGLIGAFFIGFAPFSIALGQGYAFGDITDTPLIGLTPLLVFAAVMGWQTGKLRWLIIAGVVQGSLYLTKGALGLAPVAIVIALFLSDWIFRPESGWEKPGWRGLLAFLGTTVLVILPFYIYFNVAFHQTMAYENGTWVKAFFSNNEGWGSPADYHLTLYFYVVYGTAIAFLLLFSTLLVGWIGIARQSRADLIIFVWIIAVYLPITVAITKTPSMGVPAMGAFGLAAGRLISLTLFSREWHWRAIGIGVMTSAVLMGFFLMTRQTTQSFVDHDLSPRMINPSSAFFRIVDPKRGIPLFQEIFFAVVVGSVVWGIAFVFQQENYKALLQRFAGVTGYPSLYSFGRLLFIAVVLAFLGLYIVNLDVAYVARPDLTITGPGPTIGPYLEQHTAPNTSIFITDEAISAQQGGYDYLRVMFYAHRDTYTVLKTDAQTLCPLIQDATNVSSPAVLVTQDSYPGTLIGTVGGWSVYRLAPCA